MQIKLELLSLYISILTIASIWFLSIAFLFQAMVQEVCVGAIVCKLDMHKKMFHRGYIAMLAVDSKHRRKNIGEVSSLYVKDQIILCSQIRPVFIIRMVQDLYFLNNFEEQKTSVRHINTHHKTTNSLCLMRTGNASRVTLYMNVLGKPCTKLW